MRRARNCPVARSCLLSAFLIVAVASCSNNQPTNNAGPLTTNEPGNAFLPGQTGSVSDDSLAAPPTPVLNVRATAAKLVFNWPPPPAQSTSRIVRFNLVTREYSPLFSTSGNLVTEYALPLAAHRTDWHNTRFLLETCDGDQCLHSLGKRIDHLAAALHSTIPRTPLAADQRHAQSLALSRDGNTLVTGANGYALVQFRVGQQWWDSATLLGNTQTTTADFAHSVAISGDGNTVAVGAPGERNPSGVEQGGAVYLYERLGEGWATTAKLGSTDASLLRFGTRVVLSDDSNWLLVGVPDARAGEVDNAGQVLVYQRISSQWQLTQSLQAGTPSTGALYGNALSLASDQGRLFVSDRATGGQVHEYHLHNGQFIPQQTINNTLPALTRFADGVVSDSTGNILAVSRRRKNIPGVSGSPSLEVLVYRRAKDDQWKLEQTIAPADVLSNNSVITLALSGDASTLSIGVVNPGSTDNSVSTYSSDRPWVTGGFAWARNRPLYSPGSGHDKFAHALALSEDGATLVVAAPGTVIDGLTESGEIYVW